MYTTQYLCILYVYICVQNYVSLSLVYVKCLLYAAIFRFELVKSVTEQNSALMFPRDISRFIKELENSQFIECNTTRADIFNKKFSRDESDTALRFRHRAWKLLSRAKSVLDSLGIPFWLSSGTCLGKELCLIFSVYCNRLISYKV